MKPPFCILSAIKEFAIGAAAFICAILLLIFAFIFIVCYLLAVAAVLISPIIAILAAVKYLFLK